jgi:protein-tyrosine phosphatase
MVAAIDEIESSQQVTYVHCWAGKGRSATLVAGVLIARGLATNADDAERYMQARRPIVKLSRSQRQVVNAYAARVGAAM